MTLPPRRYGTRGTLAGGMKRGPALLALFAMTTNGCSFAFVRGPGDVESPPRVYPECTESLAWPVVDGVMGLFSLAFAASPTQDRYDPETDSYEKTDRSEQLIAGLLMAAAYVGGAIYGYSRVSACKDARLAFASSVPQQMPPPYYPYGYPAPQYPYPSQPPPPYTYPQPYPTQPSYPQQPPQAQPGMEGGQCLAGATCGAGLVCASTICVRQPPPPATSPAAGAEGGACLANATCGADLTCASGLCVRPPTR